MKKLVLTFVAAFICVIFFHPVRYLCRCSKMLLILLLLSNGVNLRNLCFSQSKAFIPDTNFRNFLNTTYPAFMDGSGDSLLIDSAATLTGTLNCGNQNIADLTGVEYFVNIIQLSCYFNQLTNLPALTNNTALKWLDCDNNQLTTLPDLTDNTALQALGCSYNQLTVMPDLTSNTALQVLNCSYNQLTTLPDLTNNTALLRLRCDNNQLTALPDLTNNTALRWLHCYYNQLTALPDLTNNTALRWLLCYYNQLTALPDLTNNTALSYLWCDNNKLDFSDARELRIADTISTLTTYVYSPQNPFGVADTFNLNVGETLILNIANQDSALSYQWFRGPDTIASATDTLLIIPNVILADSGVYTCRSYGTALDSPPMNFGPGISSFVSEEFLVNILPVGISKLFDTDNWLKLYPNPNTGEFTLEMEISEKQDIQINITNILGQSVYAETLNNINGKYKKQIDLKPNPTGIYNLQILNDKNMINKKIVLQK